MLHNAVALLIFPFLQTNITPQMWPSAGKGLFCNSLPVPHSMQNDIQNLTSDDNMVDQKVSVQQSILKDLGQDVMTTKNRPPVHKSRSV